MSRKKLYLIGLKSVLLAAIIITVITKCEKTDVSVDGNIRLPHLNELITNEDSDIDELKALDKRIQRYMTH